MLTFQGKLKQTFLSLSHCNRDVILVINAEKSFFHKILKMIGQPFGIAVIIEQF